MTVETCDQTSPQIPSTYASATNNDGLFCPTTQSDTINITTHFITVYLVKLRVHYIFIMTSYTKGTKKNKKKVLKNHMVDKYEIKNNMSCAKHGRLTYSDPSVMKSNPRSIRAKSTVP